MWDKGHTATLCMSNCCYRWRTTKGGTPALAGKKLSSIEVLDSFDFCLVVLNMQKYQSLEVECASMEKKVRGNMNDFILFLVPGIPGLLLLTVANSV